MKHTIHTDTGVVHSIKGRVHLVLHERIVLRIHYQARHTYILRSIVGMILRTRVQIPLILLLERVRRGGGYRLYGSFDTLAVHWIQTRQ